MTLERLISDTVDNVAAMREGAGKDVDIILEIHRKLTPMNAVALAQELEQFHPLFYEDPIQIDSMVLQGSHRTAHCATGRQRRTHPQHLGVP